MVSLRNRLGFPGQGLGKERSSARSVLGGGLSVIEEGGVEGRGKRAQRHTLGTEVL